MDDLPIFASIGNAEDTIEVLLSFKIVKLFSEGLYSSPNKAIEEIVSNSFDAGAQIVHVMLSEDLNDDDATIAVLDDGEGMDQIGFKNHWLIGESNKRDLKSPPKGRKQIGKFGIGKLSTYVLAHRLTHICKCDGKYFSASMDFRKVNNFKKSVVEPTSPVNIDLLTLSESDAMKALHRWTNSNYHGVSEQQLFGTESLNSWTLCVMSALKPKAIEIKRGTLSWVLRTALPLRSDFQIWLNNSKLKSSMINKGLIKRWYLGKDLTDIQNPAPSGITVFDNTENVSDLSQDFGLEVPGLGRISGYAEAYEDLLTGKSDQIGRSYGFFVYVHGRLINVDDGHFGISPNELRHGTFGRFRLIVNIDSLDDILNSSRERINDSPLLETAKNTLHGIFNAVRRTIDQFDRDEPPGATLARRIAESPASHSRLPIVKLAKATVAGSVSSKHLIIPEDKNKDEINSILSDLEMRALEQAEHFVKGIAVDHSGSSQNFYIRFDVESGMLYLNGLHPFTSAFHEHFQSNFHGKPLELLAMAEILSEAYLHKVGVNKEQFEQVLSLRDELLRFLSNRSGVESPKTVANELREARNNSEKLEKAVCNAFRRLGFSVISLGKTNQPDGLASALLPVDDNAVPQTYKLSIEAKSKMKDGEAVSARAVNISNIALHRDANDCDHAVVVAPAFQTSKGNKSSLSKQIKRDRKSSQPGERKKSITLITIDSLAKLVEIGAQKNVGLLKLRELFRSCSLPSQCDEWIKKISKQKITRPPYESVVQCIENFQRNFPDSTPTFGAVRWGLSQMDPPCLLTETQLIEACNLLSQLVPEFVSVNPPFVWINQSAENILRSMARATID